MKRTRGRQIILSRIISSRIANSKTTIEALKISHNKEARQIMTRIDNSNMEVTIITIAMMKWEITLQTKTLISIKISH